MGLGRQDWDTDVPLHVKAIPTKLVAETPCLTCGARRGEREGRCAVDWGGDHAETDAYSSDWGARALRAEQRLLEKDVRISELLAESLNEARASLGALTASMAETGAVARQRDRLFLFTLIAAGRERAIAIRDGKERGS